VQFGRFAKRWKVESTKSPATGVQASCRTPFLRAGPGQQRSQPSVDMGEIFGGCWIFCSLSKALCESDNLRYKKSRFQQILAFAHYGYKKATKRGN